MFGLAGLNPRRTPLFELGPYWLNTEREKPGYYRYWWDRGASRVCRARVAGKTLEEAKLSLAEFVVKGAPKNADSHLAPLLEAYFTDRTDKLPSADVARRAGARVLRFFEQEKKAKTPRVFQFDDDTQADFMEWSARKGNSPSTISRGLSVIAAALAHGKVESVEIESGESAIEDVLIERGLVLKASAQRYVPTDEEFARFLDHAEGPLLRAFIIMLNTGCRPGAALDLSPSQRNKELGLLSLNPEGRRQTKKHRPVIRVSRCFGGWLDEWEREAPGARYVSTITTVDGLQSAINRTREIARVPRIVAYSCRHKVATIFRRARVSEDQIALWLGHRRPNLRTTGLYGEYEPDYLREAQEAIDKFVVALQEKAARPLTDDRLQRAIREFGGSTPQTARGKST